MAYSNTTELTDYATARGYTLVKDLSVLLTLAHDWIEAQTYKGAKTDPEQTTQFPRTGVTIQGVAIPDDVVPEAIKRAEMQMAIEIDRGNDPYAPITKSAIREKVDTLEVEYSDQPSAIQSTIIRSVTPLLKDYLLSSGGLNIVRGY